MRRTLFGAAAAGGLALAIAGAGPRPAARAAEVVRLEAVGAMPLRPDAPRTQSPRDAALAKALTEAVRRAALDLLPALDPAESASLVDEALGDDPFAYATRFRILEDRGESPALFVEDPEVESEYVVLVEAHVDLDRVRERLAANGLLEPSGETRRVEVRLVVEELESFAAYAALRRALLEDLGVRLALPVEMERGRAVLLVETDREADALLEELLRTAPPELHITTLDTRGDTLVLRVDHIPPPADPGDPLEEQAEDRARAIDTRDRNRY